MFLQSVLKFVFDFFLSCFLFRFFECFFVFFRCLFVFLKLLNLVICVCLFIRFVLCVSVCFMRSVFFVFKVFWCFSCKLSVLICNFEL